MVSTVVNKVILLSSCVKQDPYILCHSRHVPLWFEISTEIYLLSIVVIAVVAASPDENVIQ